MPRCELGTTATFNSGAYSISFIGYPDGASVKVTISNNGEVEEYTGTIGQYYAKIVLNKPLKPGDIITATASKKGFRDTKIKRKIRR